MEQKKGRIVAFGICTFGNIAFGAGAFGNIAFGTVTIGKIAFGKVTIGNNVFCEKGGCINVQISGLEMYE